MKGRCTISRDELRRLYEQTRTPAVEIARIAGIQYGSVRVRASLSGWRRPPRMYPIIGERPCTSCGVTLPAKHGMPRCGACDRARFRYGSCACGWARRRAVATCPKCGAANATYRPAGRVPTDPAKVAALLSAIVTEPTASVAKIAGRVGIKPSTACVIVRRAGIDPAARYDALRGILPAAERRRRRAERLAERRARRSYIGSRPCGCGSRGRHRATCPVRINAEQSRAAS